MDHLIHTSSLIYAILLCFYTKVTTKLNYDYTRLKGIQNNHYMYSYILTILYFKRTQNYSNFVWICYVLSVIQPTIPFAYTIVEKTTDLKSLYLCCNLSIPLLYANILQVHLLLYGYCLLSPGLGAIQHAS